MRTLASVLNLCLGLAPTLAGAGTLAAPTGPIVLTITGAIDNTNADGAAVFDMAMLDALPGRTARVPTPWYDTDRTFSGPLLSAVLDAVGAHGDALTVTAVNNYSAELPVTDATEHPVIFATRIDGKTLSVREKGPLFVIYPFDLDKSLYDETHFGRSVWQVIAADVH